MDASVIVQIFACALATLCSIGAMGIAIWTVHESRRPQPSPSLSTFVISRASCLSSKTSVPGLPRTLRLAGSITLWWARARRRT